MPTHGTVYFDGQPVTAASIAQVRARTAFIAQRPEMGAENVRDALLLPFTFRAHQHQRPGQERLCNVLQRLQLEPTILDRPCRVLSGGELQRTAIARALLLGKTLFLLDEITAGLDPDSTRAVIDLFSTLPTTVLSVSHDPKWIASCTRVLHVADGRIHGTDSGCRLPVDHRNREPHADARDH